MTDGKKQLISVQEMFVTKCHTVVCLVWEQIQHSRLASRYLNGVIQRSVIRSVGKAHGPKIGKRVACFFKTENYLSWTDAYSDSHGKRNIVQLSGVHRSCTTNNHFCTQICLKRPCTCIAFSLMLPCSCQSGLKIGRFNFRKAFLC